MIAKLENLRKIHFTSAGTFKSNEKSSIKLNKKEVLVISCQLTCSKNTILTIMGCIIHPNEGILEINGKSCIIPNLKEIAMVKQQTLGVVFKNHNLIDTLNAEDNVAFSLRIQEINENEIKQKTKEVLKKVHMYHQRKKMPKHLNSFEQKKIAIAKALINNPKIIVCDNPTSFLDFENGITIMKLLKEIANQGNSIVVVNQEKRYNDFADRVVKLKNVNIN
jgi:putative ABC transport system ATP-binding protein